MADADTPPLGQPLKDAIRLAIHDRQCSPKCRHRNACSHRWVQYVRDIPAAVAHLREHPRDAAGARLILHDAVCVSCRHDDGTINLKAPGRVDHAKTQAKTVAAIREVLATQGGPNA